MLHETYLAVFDGEIECPKSLPSDKGRRTYAILEQVFSIFNNALPTGYCSRSLSVGDIVQLEGLAIDTDAQFMARLLLQAVLHETHVVFCAISSNKVDIDTRIRRFRVGGCPQNRPIRQGQRACLRRLKALYLSVNMK